MTGLLTRDVADELEKCLKSILTGPALNTLLQSHLVNSPGIAELSAKYGEEKFKEAVGRVATELARDFPKRSGGQIESVLCREFGLPKKCTLRILDASPSCAHPANMI
jgi:hypothetical protein